VNPGDICVVCKRVYWREQCGDDHIEGCSEFCASVPEEALDSLATLKPGDFGLWPCSECGCVMEDEYNPGGWCSGCSPKVRIRELEAVLRDMGTWFRREREHRAMVDGRVPPDIDLMIMAIQVSLQEQI
jgi:hypothetical protein